MRPPALPPNEMELIGSTDAERLLALVGSGIGNQPRNRYLHWDQMRHRP